RHHHRLRRPHTLILHRQAPYGPAQLQSRWPGQQAPQCRASFQARRRQRQLHRAPAQRRHRTRQRDSHVRGHVRHFCRGHERKSQIHRPPHPQAEAPPGPDRGRRYHGTHSRRQLSFICHPKILV
ncbi:phenylalanine ammonia-lyase, partial [Phtheirospermum japonicum]